MAPGFCWYELLTTDLGRGQRFYGDVFGWRVEQREGSYQVFRSEGGPVGGLRALPDRARAMGAPPHWLGHISVGEVSAATSEVSERGALLLGPAQQVPGVGGFALIRDPGGAIVALSETPLRSEGAFAVRELSTVDSDAAWRFYEPLLGWRPRTTWELGEELGPYLVGESEGGQRGGMSNRARLPDVHCHWAYYVATDDAQAACERAAAAGGRVVFGPFETPAGDFVAYVEDDLGAAFGLCELRKAGA